MLLLQIVTFNPTIVYNIAGFIALVIGLVGSFFKQQNSISLLKQENATMKENQIRLEDRVNNSETKIQTQLTVLDKKLEDRLGQVYDKIEKLPQDLSILFKNIVGNNNK